MLEARKKKFQRKILSWYSRNKRDLPWRKTRDPYKILVSEIMLQQTQVERVIPYYERWLKRFPDFAALAAANKSDVLKYWSGLGYNNRALRLQALAKIVAKEHHGKLPEDYETLLKLPGVGPYIAAAVLAFAFNKEIAVVDTNIRRILIHEFGLHENLSLIELRNIAASLIPRGKSCIWHNALMDYGALHLTARRTGIAAISKQSRFEGSDREVRGWIVKQLITEKSVSLKIAQRKFPAKNVRKIVQKLEEEGLIDKKKEILSLQ